VDNTGIGLSSVASVSTHWGFSSYYLIEKEVEKFLAEAEINRVAPISRKKLGPHPPGKKRTIRLAISHRETGWHHLVGIIEKQGGTI
jgi:hypothetical protein